MILAHQDLPSMGTGALMQVYVLHQQTLMMLCFGNASKCTTKSNMVPVVWPQLLELYQSFPLRLGIMSLKAVKTWLEKVISIVGRVKA